MIGNRLSVAAGVALAAGLLAGRAWAAAPYVYVVTNGTPGVTPTAPYTDWATAATNIQTAVDYASTNIATYNIVVVSNSTYTITDQILITNAITVRSFTGGLANASNTTINAGNVYGRRVVYVNHAGAVLDGFTITGGKKDYGAGVYLAMGTVQNCRITANHGGLDVRNFGVGMWVGAGGLVSNCLIFANAANECAGAGIYIDGGIVRHSTISDNRLDSDREAWGGGINSGSSATLVESCIIANNSVFTTFWGHGGGYYGQGTLRNCLITGNSVALGAYYPSYGGGVCGNFWSPPVLLENCTVVGNDAPDGGGGVCNGTMMNSIVWHNTSVATVDFNYCKNPYYVSPEIIFNYSCTAPAPASGTGNKMADPLFVDAAGGDYTLSGGSSCNNAGENQTWMVGATDLAGNPRIRNAVVDMGAYEGIFYGALQCGLAADATSIVPPSNVVFTAYVAGTNRNVTSYTWNFGDGQTTNGATLAVVTNRYTAVGLYTVTLTVTNDANESFTVTNAGYIAVWGANAYVSTNSLSPAVPYNTWTNASRTIGDAVVAAPAGTVVIVTNGTYTISMQIVINKAMTVRSFGNGGYGGLGNASNTLVGLSSPGDIRIFKVTHASGELDGFTILNGGSKGYYDEGGLGGGVYLKGGGLVRNCILRDNGKGGDSTVGAAVYMTGGTVSNCVIRANNAAAGGTMGVIYAISGLITHCQVFENTGAPSAGTGGAAVYLDGASATLRNCQVARNTNTTEAYNGGGVYLNNGAIQSCTIVSNSITSTGNGGGIYRGTGGTVSNSIVYFNYVGGVPDNLNTTDGLYYSCSINPGTTANGNITDDPLFTNLAGGDYTLQETSPCINKGSYQTWMTGAKDLAGNPRILNAVVDMGAYEYVPSKGTMLLLW